MVTCLAAQTEEYCIALLYVHLFIVILVFSYFSLLFVSMHARQCLNAGLSSAFVDNVTVSNTIVQTQLFSFHRKDRKKRIDRLYVQITT